MVTRTEYQQKDLFLNPKMSTMSGILYDHRCYDVLEILMLYSLMFSDGRRSGRSALIFTRPAPLKTMHLACNNKLAK